MDRKRGCMLGAIARARGHTLVLVAALAFSVARQISWSPVDDVMSSTRSGIILSAHRDLSSVADKVPKAERGRAEFVRAAL